jgi:hypothetical protein
MQTANLSLLNYGLSMAYETVGTLFLFISCKVNEAIPVTGRGSI